MIPSVINVPTVTFAIFLGHRVTTIATRRRTTRRVVDVPSAMEFPTWCSHRVGRWVSEWLDTPKKCAKNNKCTKYPNSQNIPDRGMPSQILFLETNPVWLHVWGSEMARFRWVDVMREEYAAMDLGWRNHGMHAARLSLKLLWGWSLLQFNFQTNMWTTCFSSTVITWRHWKYCK